MRHIGVIQHSRSILTLYFVDLSRSVDTDIVRVRKPGAIQIHLLLELFFVLLFEGRQLESADMEIIG